MRTDYENKEQSTKSIEEYDETELAALAACDITAGLSTEGRFPGILHVDSLLRRGLIADVRTERRSWREFHWFRTTPEGRKHYESKAAPIGNW